MATVARRIMIGTGCSSGLGFEVVRQLLQQSQPYKFILGVRDTKGVQAAYDGLSYDKEKHELHLLPLELADLRTVKKFSSQALTTLDGAKCDYLMLNAGMSRAADQPGVNGSKWSETYVVNHLSQHYLVHLLRSALVSSKTRIVFVSSGAIRGVSDTSTLEATLKAESGASLMDTYSGSKFTQLLGAHYWRRNLPECEVVAVSPGLILDTKLGRYAKDLKLLPDEIMKDAKPLDVGGRSILAAFTRSDFPEDPQRIFLTSWGEWWGTDVYPLSLDEQLQDKWCPSLETIQCEERTE